MYPKIFVLIYFVLALLHSSLSSTNVTVVTQTVAEATEATETGEAGEATQTETVKEEEPTPDYEDPAIGDSTTAEQPGTAATMSTATEDITEASGEVTTKPSVTNKQEVATTAATIIDPVIHVTDSSNSIDKITGGNACASTPCGNGGKCINVGESYKCNCTKGWKAEENCYVPICNKICTPGICVRPDVCGACGDINLVEPDCKDLRVDGLLGSLFALLTITISIGLCNIASQQYKSKRVAVGIAMQQDAL